MLLNCFSLLMFQGVGFLHLKLPQLPVLLDYFVKQTNKPHIRQSVFTDTAWLCMLFCAVLSSMDILFRPKFLSNLCIPKPASAIRLWRPNCSSHASYKLALFSFETIKKDNKLFTCGFLFSHDLAVVTLPFQFFGLTWECITQIQEVRSISYMDKLV